MFVEHLTADRRSMNPYPANPLKFFAGEGIRTLDPDKVVPGA
jgi:hypothetical protein